MRNFLCKLIRYDDVIAQKSFFVSKSVIKLTQNIVLNVDRKPGSANRLALLSSVYRGRFRR